jgi:GntR family transcriptional regulator
VTVPALVVDTDDPTPPYEQLRRQFAEMIRAGVLRAGDRLPPLRQLAADLGLAVGTVARTYRELESAALVRSRRGGGTRVADSVPVPEVKNGLRQYAEAFVAQARLHGAADEQIVEAVARALDSPPPSPR